MHVSLYIHLPCNAFDRIEFRVIHHCHNAISAIISISSHTCQSPLCVQCTHVIRRSMRPISTQPAPNIRCMVASFPVPSQIFSTRKTLWKRNIQYTYIAISLFCVKLSIKIYYKYSFWKIAKNERITTTTTTAQSRYLLLWFIPKWKIRDIDGKPWVELMVEENLVSAVASRATFFYLGRHCMWNSCYVRFAMWQL